MSGKGGKTRYLPLHPGTHALIHEYIEAAGHGQDDSGALFRPLRNTATGELDKAITSGRRIQAGARLLGRARFQDRRTRAAGDGGDQRARPQSRYRQSAGMAGARQHRHHTDLRPPANASGGQPDVQSELLKQDGGRTDIWAKTQNELIPSIATIRQYTPAKSVSNILFWIAAALSITVLLIDKAMYSALYEIAQIVFALAVIALFGLGLMLRLYWSPQAEDARRSTFISDAYGVAMRLKSRQEL